MTLLIQILLYVSIFWLIYVYFLYPILLSFLSKFFGTKVKRDFNYKPKVSFVMAAHNEEQLIRGRLQCYIDLNYPKELLSFYIGSDYSTDKTDEIIEEFQKINSSIFLKKFQRTGKTKIVYELAQETDSEIIIFTDADILMPPDSLNSIVSSFTDPTVGGIVTNILYSDNAENIGNKGEKKFLQIETNLRSNEANFYSTVAPTGPCFAVRKGSYYPMDDYRLSDDLHLTISIPDNGFRVCFDREAKIYEINKRSLESEFKRRIRVGEQAMSTILSYKSTKYPWRSWIGFQMWSHRLLRNISIIPAITTIVLSVILCYKLDNDLLTFPNFDSNIIFWLIANLGLISISLIIITFLFHKINIKIPFLHYLLFSQQWYLH